VKIVDIIQVAEVCSFTLMVQVVVIRKAVRIVPTVPQVALEYMVMSRVGMAVQAIQVQVGLPMH
jgi:hypothetical protein